MFFRFLGAVTVVVSLIFFSVLLIFRLQNLYVIHHFVLIRIKLILCFLEFVFDSCQRIRINYIFCHSFLYFWILNHINSLWLFWFFYICLLGIFCGFVIVFFNCRLTVVPIFHNIFFWSCGLFLNILNRLFMMWIEQISNGVPDIL